MVDDSGLAVALAKLNGAGWLLLSEEEKKWLRGEPLTNLQLGREPFTFQHESEWIN